MENNSDPKSIGRLTDQMLWEKREIYMELLEQYLSLRMDSEEVVDNFFGIYRNHHNEIEGLPAYPERLKKIQITSKSEGFTELIEFIFCICEALDIEETDYNSTYPMSENRFRDEISLRLQELKDYD